MRVHFVQRVALLSTNTNILPQLHFFLIFLVTSYSWDCFSVLLFTFPRTQSRNCTIMQTNTTKCYGIFLSTELCGVDLPNLRLAARSVWNFAFSWHAKNVAQSVRYFTVKKQVMSCVFFRGVEFGMKGGNQSANTNRKNHYIHRN
jgi:hypothetical protein